MFQHLKCELEDPIFKIMSAFQHSNHPMKLDLGIGVFRDDRGDTPIFRVVKQAEKIVYDKEVSKAYLGPAGDKRFNEVIGSLLLADACPADEVEILQTPGGTGALSVSAKIIANCSPQARVWLSDPAWSTHLPIFREAGLQIQHYPYFNRENHLLDFRAMLSGLEKARRGDVVLLQACAHNPTGCNLTVEQWHQVADFCDINGLIPLLDMAYHGFQDGLQEDLIALQVLAAHLNEWVVCYSLSKNFSLYNDRVGALLIHSGREQQDLSLRNLALNQICSSYYMPPAHGASVVVEILTNDALCQLWRKEMGKALTKLNHLRDRLVTALITADPCYCFLETQKGLFLYLDLDEKSLFTLQQEGIFLGAGGRLNITGINDENLPRVVAAICQL